MEWSDLFTRIVVDFEITDRNGNTTIYHCVPVCEWFGGYSVLRIPTISELEEHIGSYDLNRARVTRVFANPYLQKKLKMDMYNSKYKEFSKKSKKQYLNLQKLTSKMVKNIHYY